MMSMILMLALMASDAPAGGSAAAATTTPAPATAPATPPKGDELICHSEKDLGSNLPHRVCRRQSDIDARTQADRDALERIQSLTGSASTH